MTDVTGKQVHRRLARVAGLLGVMLASLLASAAVAEQPPHLIKLRDNDRGASRADAFDISSRHDLSASTALSAPSYHAKTLSEVGRQPTPQWPQSSSESVDVTAPVIVMRSNRVDGEGNEFAWGLAGTGASIFTGALLFHIESMALQDEYEQLSTATNPRRYREIRNQIDQTRKFVMTLYAVGGSMVTSGVVLMATDDHDGDGLTAKLVPHWMHGNPAARLKVSF